MARSVDYGQVDPERSERRSEYLTGLAVEGSRPHQPNATGLLKAPRPLQLAQHRLTKAHHPSVGLCRKLLGENAGGAEIVYPPELCGLFDSNALGLWDVDADAVPVRLRDRDGARRRGDCGTVEVN